MIHPDILEALKYIIPVALALHVDKPIYGKKKLVASAKDNSDKPQEKRVYDSKHQTWPR